MTRFPAHCAGNCPCCRAAAKKCRTNWPSHTLNRPRIPAQRAGILLALPTQSSQESGAGNTASPEAGSLSEIIYTARAESWHPGQLHPNLSWTHYRTLLRVDNADARAFFEIEAIENRWSARELERQINSLLYERLALSKDTKTA